MKILWDVQKWTGESFAGNNKTISKQSFFVEQVLVELVVLFVYEKF